MAEAVVVIGSPSELLIGKEQSDAVVRLLTLAATASGLVPRDLFVLLNGPNPTRALVIGDWLRGLQPLERQLAEQNLGQLQAAGFRVDVLPGLPTTDVPAEVEQVGKLQTKRTVHPSWQTLQHRKGQGHAKYYHWIRSTAAAELYERFWFVEWDVAFTGKWSTLFDRELRRGPADVVAAKTYRTSCWTDPQARALRPPCGTRGRRVPKAHLYLERVERRFVVEMGAILDEGDHAGFFELFVPYACKEMLLVKRSAVRVAVDDVQVVHDDAGAAARHVAFWQMDTIVHHQYNDGGGDDRNGDSSSSSSSSSTSTSTSTSGGGYGGGYGGDARAAAADHSRGAGAAAASGGAPPITFLYKFKPGTSRSYGLNVARLAGVPRHIVDRAAAVAQQFREDTASVAHRRRPRHCGGQQQQQQQQQQEEEGGARGGGSSNSTVQTLRRAVAALDLNAVTRLWHQMQHQHQHQHFQG
eukprot:g5241.t1